jgi:beta-glucanase (GH16 family)
MAIMCARKVSAAIALTVAVFQGSAAAAPAGIGALVWSDEFNGTSLDATKWSVNEPGVWGDAINSASSASVANGALTITTYTDPASGKNYAAVLGTQGRYLTTYGYFESRIKFSSSPGMWSAFWLESPTVGKPIGDPVTAGVEIDVTEHRATDDVGASITGRYNTALHWDGYGADHKFVSHLNGPVAGLGNGSWHTYGLWWNPQGYTFYLDDVPMWTKSSPLSAAAEYMLLSSEVQDNSWAGFIPSGGYGSLAASTTNMQVDYVHVYSVPTPEPAALLLLPAALVLIGRRSRRTSPV